MQKQHNIKIGQMLVEAGVITPEQLERALKAQAEKRGEPLCSSLARLGIASEERVLPILAAQLKIPYLSLKQTHVGSDLLKQIPARLAAQYNVLPVAQEGNVLKVAMADPLDTRVLDELRMLTRAAVQPVVVSPGELREAIRHHYGVGAETVEAMVATAELPPAEELTE